MPDNNSSKSLFVNKKYKNTIYESKWDETKAIF